MFGRMILLFAVGIVLASSFCASQASAQMGIGGGAYGLGFFNYGAYSYGGNYRMPYYALYPPVYYSYPVARPYGYSPFAYPPGTITPEAPPQAAAVEFRNPFVPQPAKASADKSASAPAMYYNQFVKQSRPASTVAVAQ
jgi:hypothetical protein